MQYCGARRIEWQESYESRQHIQPDKRLLNALTCNTILICYQTYPLMLNFVVEDEPHPIVVQEVFSKDASNED